MSIVSVDDLVSRPITVMNTIQEVVHVENRLEYSQALRYVRTSITLSLHEVSKPVIQKDLRECTCFVGTKIEDFMASDWSIGMQ